MVNIKLDKTGGLTEALALRAAARPKGRVMVGCMVGSSLAMAPAVLVAQGAEVDLSTARSSWPRTGTCRSGSTGSERVHPAPRALGVRGPGPADIIRP
jgi:L-alanine-DL-glutamate epimerase-like enolase superfamily enzyme